MDALFEMFENELPNATEAEIDSLVSRYEQLTADSNMRIFQDLVENA